MTLYSRAWFIVPGVNDYGHMQLWNKGTQDIVLVQWSVFTAAPTIAVAGPTGNGDPNQNPLDGSNQRLASLISAPGYGASFANGVDGSANGLPDGPPSALSKHGEIRAMMEPLQFVLAQSDHFYASTTGPISTPPGGIPIPIGHGWTIRAGKKGVPMACSFKWFE